MKIELTPDQHLQINASDEHPIGVRDPQSQRDYVLLTAEEYKQMLEIVRDDLQQRSLRRPGARTLAKRLADERP
jgi:hypothetical protein